jgi:hypothetical protein
MVSDGAALDEANGPMTELDSEGLSSGTNNYQMVSTAQAACRCRP